MRLSLITVIAVALGVCSCGANEAKKVHEYNKRLLEQYRLGVVKALEHAKANQFAGCENVNVTHIRVKEPNLGLVGKFIGSNNIQEGNFQLETSNDGVNYEWVTPVKIEEFSASTFQKPSLKLYLAPFGMVDFDARGLLTVHHIYDINLEAGTIRYVDYSAVKRSGESDQKAYTKYFKFDK